MGIALKAEDVAIRYITGDFKDIGIKEYTMRRLTGNYHITEFMAVDGVSFELEDGDMLGIIGSNGAGKSTLLKAIAGIMAPTRGKITANGEVAALLELGSGFDGDLTVRENAYLRGAMLGYTREFMDNTYRQIIEFAELQGFDDRPFKQLSSGMKSRLAFSIASMVEPDILILDEVLSVGDGAFQDKSAKKMREIISKGAATILVSHSLSQIRELCNKVLWLDHGRQIAFGETEVICDQYERFLKGECLVETPKGGRSEDEGHAAEHPDAELHSDWLSKLWSRPMSFRTVASFCVMLSVLLACLAYMGVTGRKDGTTVEIEALLEEGNVTFRGASVDNKWYNPEDILRQGNWEEDSNERTLTAVGRQPLKLQIPMGEVRALIFNVGPNEGAANIRMDGETTGTFHFYQETLNELGYAFTLPQAARLRLDGKALIFSSLVFLVTLSFSLLVGRRLLKSAGKAGRLRSKRQRKGQLKQ